MKNKTVEEVLKLEAQKCSITDIIPLISGKRVAEAWETGNVDIAPMMVGQSIGLIRDIPTTQELLERMEKEAKEHLKRAQDCLA